MMSAYAGQAYNSNQIAILSLLSVLLAIALFLISLRCYVRITVKHAFGWDDGLAVIAFLLAVVSAAFVYLTVYYGSGQHSYALPNPDYQIGQAIRWNLGYQIANVTGTCFMRESIMALLLRLQPQKTFKYWIYFFMALMATATIILFSLFVAQCQPLEKVWDPTTPGTCLPPDTAYDVGYAQSAISIIVDLFCTISPVVLLWHIKISLRKKVCVVALMSLGLISTISIALRNVYIPELTEADPTWDTPIVIVTIIEQYVGLIAACVPVIATLIFDLSTKLGSRLRSGLSGRTGPFGRNSKTASSYTFGSDGKDTSLRESSKEGEEQSFDLPDVLHTPIDITTTAHTMEHNEGTFDAQENITGMYNGILRG